MICVTGDIHGTLETDKVVNFFKEQAIKQFLSKEDLFELIPSKDMRKYLDEQGRKFSDFEKATLIYNSRGFKKIEKEHALKELAQSTQDDKLIKQNPVKVLTAEDSKRFEHAYIDIPYPFRTGDIVCIVDSESSDRFGVVTHIRTEMEYQACRDKLNRLNLDGHVDFSDCAVTVNVIEKNGSFSNVHINPLRLEFTEVSENNPLKSVLECARDLLIGSGDLEEFQRSCKELLESV